MTTFRVGDKVRLVGGWWNGQEGFTEGVSALLQAQVPALIPLDSSSREMTTSGTSLMSSQ